MEANELRIGNYITWTLKNKKESTPTKVDLVCTDGVCIKTDVSIPINEVNPIPLTEEWLIKNLSEYIDGSEHSQYGRFIPVGVLYIQFPRFELQTAAGNYLGVTVKYVHQLQNLYFAICGEELTING